MPEKKDDPMRQGCIDKVLEIVNDKIDNHAKMTGLETKNLMLKLRSDIKEDMTIAIKEAMRTVRERTNWGMEILRLTMTIASLLAAMVAYMTLS